MLKIDYGSFSDDLFSSVNQLNKKILNKDRLYERASGVSMVHTLEQITTVVINPKDLELIRNLQNSERDAINLDIVTTREILKLGIFYYFQLESISIKLMVNKSIQPGYFLAIIGKGELA